ncbi:MAG: hypothetical protein GY778_13810 [bacterium]|nr:hypothetical protein [bacterium]
MKPVLVVLALLVGTAAAYSVWPMRSAFRLLWSPFSLAVVAVHTPPRQALTAWVVVAGLEISLILSSIATGLGEPFRSLEDYFTNIVVCTLSMGAVMGAGLAFAIAFVMYGLVRFQDIPVRKRDAALSVMWLALLPALLPVVAWCICAALHPVRHPSFGLGSGKPAWIASPLIPMLGSPWWLLVAFAMVVVNCWVALRRLTGMPLLNGIPACVECGYNLTGNTSGRCPECGVSL